MITLIIALKYNDGRIIQLFISLSVIHYVIIISENNSSELKWILLQIIPSLLLTVVLPLCHLCAVRIWVRVSDYVAVKTEKVNILASN